MSKSGLRLVGFYPRAIFVLIVLLALAPLLAYGVAAGHDWLFELTRAREYFLALRSGQAPPYYASNLYGGYGSPIFLYYPPLFLFVASLFQFLLPLKAAVALAGLCFLLVGGFGIRALCRAADLEGAAARIVWAVYLLSPYYLLNYYIRNANAEFAALCLAPLVFAGLLDLPRRPGRGLVYLSCGLAAVILAHGLSALSVMAMLVVGAGIVYLGRMSRRLWSLLVSGIILALGLSAFYWLPAMVLRERMRLEDLQRGKFAFDENFSALGDIFSNGVTETAGFLIPLILLAAAGLAVYRAFFARSSKGAAVVQERIESRKSNKRLLVAGFVGALVFLFLNMPASRWLWEHLPFLPLFQFPSRFLGPLSLLAAILAGLCFDFFEKRFATRPIIRRATELIVLAVIVVNVLPVLLSARPLTRAQDLQLKRGASGGTTIYNEYVPRGAVAGIWQLAPAGSGPLIGPPEVDARWSRATGTFIEGSVTSSRAVRLQFARWALPEWAAKIDGRPAALSVSKFGTVELLMPAGSHRVSLFLEPPAIRRVAVWISLVTLLLFLIGLLIQRLAPGWFPAGLFAPDSGEEFAVSKDRPGPDFL